MPFLPREPVPRVSVFRRWCLAALVLSATPAARADVDACDSFGPLVGSESIPTTDRWFAGAAVGDFFGKSTAVGDFDGDGFDDLLVGAPGNDLGGRSAGAAYLFFGPIAAGGKLLASTADVVFPGEGLGAQAGWSVANAGDVNADGIDDLLIGSMGGSNSVHPAGAAHLVHGGAALAGVRPLGTAAAARFDGLNRNDQFGSALAGVGDVDGDGFEDLVIGAPGFDAGQTNTGGAWLWYGPVSGTRATPSADATVVGAVRNAAVGSAVARVGDMNGDGFDDVALGSPSVAVPNVGGTAGVALFFWGGSGGNRLTGSNSPANADFSVTGTRLSRTGSSLAAAGDVDGDGYDDVWVGARQAGTQRAGAAYLVRGGLALAGAAPVESSATAKIVGYNANDMFGSSMAGNLDFDHDGALDVVVGAERGDGAAALVTGEAWAVRGPFVGTIRLDPASSARISGLRPYDYAGSAVAGGDLNGDGLDDAVVSAWQAMGPTAGLRRQGLVGLAFGGRDEVDDLTYYSDGDGDGFGDPSTAVTSCTPMAGLVLTGDDCDDASPAAYPGAPEACQGPDTNCDGQTGAADADRDGFTACEDCNDNVAEVNPAAAELCGDDLDNNCDGLRDDPSAVNTQSWCPDFDGDGFGDTESCVAACADPGVFLVAVVQVAGDCDDRVAATHPGAVERCDAVDNNCDKVTDDESSLDAPTWFVDADQDGAGSFWRVTRACTAPAGFVANEDDCDDANAGVNPSVAETCDGVDNDCDGRLYLGGAVSLTQRRASVAGAAAGDNLGASLTLVGDQNADGLAELATGAPYYDTATVSDAGAVFLQRGSASAGDVRYADVLGDGSPSWSARLYGTREDGQFGAALASGDFNGDRVADLVVGAPTLDTRSPATGGVYIFYGPLAAGERSAATADVFFKGEATGDLFGTSLAVGDVDGDGFDDLALTATNHGGDEAGRGYLVYGSAQLTGELSIESVRGVATFDGAAGDRLGSGAAILDLDGDAYGDLVFGSGYAGANDAGAVSVAYGGAERFSGESAASAVLTGSSSTERAGLSVANGGDVNRDGLADLVIGSNASSAYLLLGSAARVTPDTVGNAASFVFRGASLRLTGQVVSGAGDVDGDGYDDLLLSSSKDSEAASNAGGVYLIYGNTTSYFSALADAKELDLDLVESFGRLDAGTVFPTFSAANNGGVEGAKLLGLRASDQIGSALAGGLDFNGDGRSDFAIGARLSDDGDAANAGGGWVFSGGPYGTDTAVPEDAQTTYYWDSDADGHANDAGATLTACPMHAPITFAAATPTLRAIPVSDAPGLDDCDDDNAIVHGGAREVERDGVDRDCDGYDSANREVVGTVSLSPTVVYTDSEATATAEFTDPDGLPVTTTFQWFVDGVEVAGQTASTLDGNYFAKGQTLQVDVYVNDVRDDWGPFTATRTVQNALPTLSACSVAPSMGDRNTTFFARDVGLGDVDPEDAGALSVEFQWQQQVGPLWLDIRGETAASLGSCAARSEGGGSCAHGSNLRATCRPYDGEAWGTTYSSAPVTITNSAPSVTTCSLSPVAPTTAQNLSAVVATSDPDGDAVNVRYEWLKNGQVQAGVTGSSFPAASQEHFDAIMVRCIPMDALGLGGETVTSGTVEVVNSLPTAPSVDLRPNSPRSDETLAVSVVSPSSDADGDTVTYLYYWTRNGAVFNNPTSPTSTASVQSVTTARGDIFDVTVVPSDGYGDGPSATDSVTVQNAPPAVASAVLSPSTAYNADDVTVQGVNWVDGDGDAPAYNVVWYVGGVAQPAQTPDPLVLSNTRSVKGQSVYAVLTPRDSYGTGTSVTTATLTVQNSAPTAPVLSIVPIVPRNEDNLTCTLSTASTDPDGDALTYTYAWYRNGAVIVGQTASTLNKSYTSTGDVFYCTARASDGTATTTGVTLTVAIQNSSLPDAPVISAPTRYSNLTSQTLTGSCSRDCDSLTLTCTGATTRTYTPTCSRSGFSQVVTTDRGATTSCSMVCRESNDRSAASNSVVMESCSPYDAYETSGSYGDSGSDPAGVAEFATLADNNAASLTITGNILGEHRDTQDWYRVVTSDNAVADATVGSNAYKFELVMETGAAAYDLWVFKNSAQGAGVCAATGPYDDYTDDFADPGDALNHARQTDDPNLCANSSALFNECQSMASTYYVKVMRPTGNDCSPYTITASNGR